MRVNHIPVEQLASGNSVLLVATSTIVECWSMLGRDGRFEVKSAWLDAGRATKVKPDILILDYMLPDINGNKVCERIRSDPDVGDMRIIIVSGAVNPNEVDGLLAAGANEFIQKPFDVDHLISRMVHLMKTA
jgi:DNA-binding response OmpR family regulator